MNKFTLSTILFFFSIVAFSQTDENSGEKILDTNSLKKVTIGGYAQIDYNEPDGKDVGKLDIHRMVLLFGYKFNEKVSFLTEIEMEHVKEIFVEQAYVKYKAGNSVNVLAGLMLIPMGIINEYHEPPTFYGVERPNVDKYIVPTTWRELGFGISGNIDNLSMKYQAYIFNGFISYKEGDGILSGSSGLRGGRQKGAESTVSSPNFSTKFDYYGIRGLRLGLAGYFGKTQTDDTTVEDSTVGVAMIGIDARYKSKKIELKGQYIHTSISNAKNYNLLTDNNIGSQMNGYYGEFAYNFSLKNKEKLTPFIRYEKYNTHLQTTGILNKNKEYDRTDLTLGLNYKVADGVSFKADYQLFDNALDGFKTQKQFNAGVAVWF